MKVVCNLDGEGSRGWPTAVPPRHHALLIVSDESVFGDLQFSNRTLLKTITYSGFIMSQYSIHPPGEKIKQAIKELSELLTSAPEKKRAQLLQQVELKYDLSPQECEFLNRHFREP